MLRDCHGQGLGAGLPLGGCGKEVTPREGALSTTAAPRPRLIAIVTVLGGLINSLGGTGRQEEYI